MNIYWIYILKNRKNSEPYYGYTNDLKRCLKEHNIDKEWKFIGCEGYASELDARERERKLKHYGQAITHLKNRLGKIVRVVKLVLGLIRVDNLRSLTCMLAGRRSVSYALIKGRQICIL